MQWGYPTCCVSCITALLAESGCTSLAGRADPLAKGAIPVGRFPDEVQQQKQQVFLSILHSWMMITILPNLETNWVS